MNAPKIVGQRPKATAVSSQSRDLRLISLIGEGDMQAFRELYVRYQPRLTRFLFNVVRRQHLVEEVLDAFAERYHLMVETMAAAEEDVFFPLPRALRPTQAAE